MMKKLTAVCLALAVILFVPNRSQAQMLDKGASFLQAGIGFGSPYLYKGSKSNIPPVHASFEHLITEKIGVGGLVGYTASTWEDNMFGNLYKWTFSYLVIGARGIYHFAGSDKTDFYGGAMLGYNVASAKFSSDDKTLESIIPEPSVGGFAFGGFLGGRLMFSDNVGAFAEVGYNIAWLSAGVTIKF